MFYTTILHAGYPKIIIIIIIITNKTKKIISADMRLWQSFSAVTNLFNFTAEFDFRLRPMSLSLRSTRPLTNG